ncbi:hypothetical protein [Streptomyces sp. NPDC006012]|uniref:hypothetical protein n=1 Tax=Streptomyces sp. NPDC006012 TaxID=3364739 RepID=UPI0036B0C263
MHNNLWDTNFPSQQAFHTTFRYAVGVRRSGESTDADALALRTACEVDHPLIGVPAHGTPDPDRPAELTLLSVDDPRIAVRDAAPVPGDDGVDLLVRLQSFATESRTVRLRCGFPVAGAERATYLGDPDGPVTLDGDDILVEIPRPGTTAVRVRLGATGVAG